MVYSNQDLNQTLHLVVWSPKSLTLNSYLFMPCASWRKSAICPAESPTFWGWAIVANCCLLTCSSVFPCKPVVRAEVWLDSGSVLAKAPPRVLLWVPYCITPGGTWGLQPVYNNSFKVSSCFQDELSFSVLGWKAEHEAAQGSWHCQPEGTVSQESLAWGPQSEKEAGTKLSLYCPSHGTHRLWHLFHLPKQLMDT